MAYSISQLFLPSWEVSILKCIRFLGHTVECIRFLRHTFHGSRILTEPHSILQPLFGGNSQPRTAHLKLAHFLTARQDRDISFGEEAEMKNHHLEESPIARLTTPLRHQGFSSNPTITRHQTLNLAQMAQLRDFCSIKSRGEPLKNNSARGRTSNP